MSREIRITPSILNADFSQLDAEIKRISEVSDLLHLDVMDDVFVPNFTFDFEAASAIIKSSVLAVDAHLMVANVDEIAVQYAELGCASVTIHAEATKNIPQTLRNIRKAGSRSSLGIKPNTDISDYSSFGIVTAGVAEEIQTPSKGRTRELHVLELWLDSVTLWRDVQDIRAVLQEAGENFGESTLSRTVKELTDDGRLETQKLVRRHAYRISAKKPSSGTSISLLIRSPAQNLR